MDKLRRSFRSSFRRKNSYQSEGEDGAVGSGSNNQQWLADEDAVKSNNCCFDVKYLGCIEVRYKIFKKINFVENSLT